jgi:hypothetical protein
LPEEKRYADLLLREQAEGEIGLEKSILAGGGGSVAGQLTARKCFGLPDWKNLTSHP